MTGHAHDHAEHDHAEHDHAGHDHDSDAGLAELLDLDAEVLGGHLAELTAWAADQVAGAPRTVVDLGAGTGTGSLALARRFPTAEVVAVDRSAAMLERVRTAADGQGLDGRLRTVRADLDLGWPGLGAVDMVWAASVLHELADPARVLRDVRGGLLPGGLLAVVEIDALPRFLPDDAAPGLERRCAEAAAGAGWNAHPDWRAELERAGLDVVAQRAFPVELSPAPPGTGRYAQAYLGRIRGGLSGRLDPDDLAVLDRLLAGDSPDAVLRRRDLTVRSSRTVWAARRPGAGEEGSARTGLTRG